MMDIELIERLQNSTEEIHKRLDVQNALMESILSRENNVNLSGFEKQSEKEKQLVKAIRDAIEILEQTKKSFKSKSLEILRKKLTNVLID